MEKTPNITETHRDLIHRTLKATRGKGYHEGIYQLSVTPDAACTFKLGSKEMSLIRQLDRLLLRVVCQNYEAMLSMAESDDPELLLDMAWSVLAPARFAGGLEGEYQVRFPNGRQVGYGLSQWDETLIRQYNDLLLAIYQQNRDALDRVIHRNAEIASGDSPTLEAA